MEDKKENGPYRQNSWYAQTVSLIFIFCFLQLFFLFDCLSRSQYSNERLNYCFRFSFLFLRYCLCRRAFKYLGIFFHHSLVVVVVFSYSNTHSRISLFCRIADDTFELISLYFFSCFFLFSLLFYSITFFQRDQKIKKKIVRFMCMCCCLWSVKRTFLSGTWL